MMSDNNRTNVRIAKGVLRLTMFCLIALFISDPVNIGTQTIPGEAAARSKKELLDDSRDWPAWRGPNHDSLSPETGWDPLALVPAPLVVWKKNVGLGYSSVVIRGRNLYTLGYRIRQDTVYCLDVLSGNEIWSFSFKCSRGEYPGAKATPCVDGGRLYVVSQDGHVFCLDAVKGNILWQKHVVKDFAAKSPLHGFAGSPVVMNNYLVLNVCRTGLVLDKHNGNLIWGSESTYCGYASPVFHSFEKRECVAFFSYNGLFGVELDTGKTRWSFPWTSQYAPDDCNVPDPVFWKNRVFLTNYYDNGSVVLEMNDHVASPLWQDKELNCFNSALTIGGHLYGVDGEPTGDFTKEKSLFCLDLTTLKIQWREPIGVGSLLAAGGRLIMLEHSGKLIIAEQSPNRYRELARAALPHGIYWTPPAFCRKHLFVRNQRGDVYCISLIKNR